MQAICNMPVLLMKDEFQRGGILKISLVQECEDMIANRLYI
jgi:hypothetical protein